MLLFSSFLPQLTIMLEIITPVFLLALMSSVHWVPEPPPIPGRGCGGPGVTEMLPFSGRLQEV